MRHITLVDRVSSKTGKAVINILPCSCYESHDPHYNIDHQSCISLIEKKLGLYPSLAYGYPIEHKPAIIQLLTDYV